MVILAGCTAFWPSNPTTPVGSPNTGNANGDFPPGITQSGVTEPWALANAHATELTNTSYTVTETSEIRYTNGTLYTRENATVQVTAEKTLYIYNSTVRGTVQRFLGGSEGTLVRYSNGSAVVRKVVQNGSTSYGVEREPNGDLAAPASVYHGTPTNDERISILFERAENVTIDEINNTTYRLRATNFDGDYLELGATSITNVTVVEFTATITSDGLVREYRLTFRGTVSGHEVEGFEHIMYSDIGTTPVSRPSWYDRAAENSS